jgi:5-formyltetrahydrofolate cyclo-ligase
VHVRRVREALPAETACPTCCSGSRATVRTGTGGWRPFSSMSLAPSTSPERLLRSGLRAARRAIQGKARDAAAQRVLAAIRPTRLLSPGRRIALYLPMAEELDCRPLIDLARSRGCLVYFPKIESRSRSRIGFYSAQGSLRRGPYGIAETSLGQRIRARDLDVVFAPLVGFDSQGTRLGMGKGFYDRCFAHRRVPSNSRRPLLLGVAYDCQELPSLVRKPLDVPLDGIVTESSIRWFGGRG